MSNLGNSVAQYAPEIELWAYAQARGKDSATDMGARLFTDVRTDAIGAVEGVARYVYERVRTRAEVIAVEAGKPLSQQSTKSRNTQIAKLNGFVKLGVIARDHDAVTEAFDYARGTERAGGRYTKTVACVVALLDVIAKDPSAADDAATLMLAVDDALEPPKAVASEAFEAIAKTLDDALTTHREAVSAATVNLPSDYVRSIEARLAKLVAVLKAAELDAVPA